MRLCPCDSRPARRTLKARRALLFVPDGYAAAAADFRLGFRSLMQCRNEPNLHLWLLHQLARLTTTRALCLQGEVGHSQTVFVQSPRRAGVQLLRRFCRSF